MARIPLRAVGLLVLMACVWTGLGQSRPAVRQDSPQASQPATAASRPASAASQPATATSKPNPLALLLPDKVKPVAAFAYDFSGKVPKEWSETKTSKTPATGMPFLGEFNKAEVKLSLTKLSEHKYARVTFDLLIIRSWDGNQGMAGPDHWSLNVAGGPMLINTTFSNWAQLSGHDTQSFPENTGLIIIFAEQQMASSESRRGLGNFPLGYINWAGTTGCLERENLGFVFRWPDEGNDPHVKRDVSSLYRMSLTFAHSDTKALGLAFASRETEGIENESWGLANVKVELFDAPPVGEVDAKAMDALWHGLREPDPCKGFQALWTLAACGDQSVEYVGTAIQTVHKQVQLDSSVKRLVVELAAADTKEKATQARDKLRDLGPWAVEPLRELIGGQPQEVQTDLKLIISSLAKERELERLRVDRAMRMMTLIGGEKAQAVAKELSGLSQVLHSEMKVPYSDDVEWSYPQP